MKFDGCKNGSGVYQAIINEMPPHRRYFELFARSASIARRKRAADETVLMDIDPEATAWLTSIDTELPRNTEIITGDAISFMEMSAREFTREDMVYLDPPYLRSVRSTKSPIYDYEFWTDEEHVRMLSLVRTINANVMISGYYSELYREYLKGWRTVSFDTTNRAGTKVKEWLWMNYDKPSELYDYRFLGKNFRERERIARKVKRWCTKLAGLPILEQNAIIDALVRNGERRQGDDASCLRSQIVTGCDGSGSTRIVPVKAEYSELLVMVANDDSGSVRSQNVDGCGDEVLSNLKKVI